MLFYLSIAYRIIFLNNVNGDAQLKYGTDVHKYWNADKPIHMTNGSKAIIQVRLCNTHSEQS